MHTQCEKWVFSFFPELNQICLSRIPQAIAACLFYKHFVCTFFASRYPSVIVYVNLRVFFLSLFFGKLPKFKCGTLHAIAWDLKRQQY